MATDRRFAFGGFCFDLRSGALRHDNVEAKLTPRAAAVLAMLAEHAPELVTKQELHEEVWGGLAVSDDALTSCIQELRQAMGDDARRPRYIETRHRRGYRLMLPASCVNETGLVLGVPPAQAPQASRLVGRAAELDALEQRFASAQSGQRQLVFVSGEPGIGKSALVGAMLERLDRRRVRIAEGQCLDHHGVGEPYLPLIEAMTRLAGSVEGGDVKAILATHAPSWLAQMPSLWTKSDRAVLQARGRATRERMLRELTQAVEVIAADVPLMLKLEDIHWSDASTLDWLAHVARRPEPARLMVVATFRPADRAAVAAGLDGITAELVLHGRCHEIALRPLNLEAIEAYLASLGDGDRNARSRDIAHLLLARTGGNPLFMVSIVSQLGGRISALADPGTVMSVPHDVRRFIDRQIDQLDENDRSLLSAASVIRREFATAGVAAALDAPAERVETACARLGRQGVFILKSGSTMWPDGTSTDLYAFRHDLYRELLYDRLPAMRRTLSHARVGRRLEVAWAARPDAIAAELAEHFDRGAEPARAIPHHQRAAAKALRRSANQEAIEHLHRAIDAIGFVEDEVERTKVEVELRVALGAAFMAIRGFGAPEVLEAYTTAEALCERLGERVELFQAIWGHWLFRAGRGETEVSRRLGGRLLALAERFGDPGLRIQAHHAMWSTSFVCGELAAACGHAQSALALFDTEIHRSMASSYGNHDAACCARNFSAMALALIGDQEGARGMIDRSLALARTLDDPFSLALTLYFTAAAAQMLGDVALAAANSELSMQMATEHDLAQPKAWSMGVAGWCVAACGDVDRGVALGTRAVATMRAIQSRHLMPYLLGLLADMELQAEHQDVAMRTAEEGIALAEATGEQFYSAELYRLRGELLAHPSIGRRREAEGAFRTAIAIARAQGARTLERRAIGSLRACSGL
jgi:DNA-binding winged helix-turn-helix (wHTH) protein/predicted ATPase